MLERIGYVDAVIARETPDGLMLIDGHLRADLVPDAEIPVLVVDLDEAEAGEVLATLDPLVAMAETDTEALHKLVEELGKQTGEALNGLLQDIDVIPPDFIPVESLKQGRLDRKKPVICPECGHAFTT